jgi:hypothetical protein
MNNNMNKEELASTYSEGCNDLYFCLINLWDNNFETIGCCTGHNGKKGYRQYIGLKKKDNKKIIELLSLLNKEDITISFLNNNVSIKKNKNKDIYENVLESIKKINEINKIAIDSEIVDTISFIDNNDYDYVNIHHYYYKGILKKYINTSDIKLINKLKEKYEYKVLDEKLPMYHFIIK